MCVSMEFSRLYLKDINKPNFIVLGVMVLAIKLLIGCLFFDKQTGFFFFQ